MRAMLLLLAVAATAAAAAVVVRGVVVPAPCPLRERHSSGLIDWEEGRGTLIRAETFDVTAGRRRKRAARDVLQGATTTAAAAAAVTTAAAVATGTTAAAAATTGGAAGATSRAAATGAATTTAAAGPAGNYALCESWLVGDVSGAVASGSRKGVTLDFSALKISANTNVNSRGSVSTSAFTCERGNAGGTFLQVFDGNSTADTLLAFVCGNSPPVSPIRGSSSQMLVRYRGSAADAASGARSFRAAFGTDTLDECTPPTVANAASVCEAGSVVALPGHDTCEVTCDTGYALVRNNLRCASGGRFTGSAECGKACTPDTLPSAATIENARSVSSCSSTSYAPGRTCSFSCDSGYDEVGSIVCSSDGTWTNNASCKDDGRSRTIGIALGAFFGIFVFFICIAVCMSCWSKITDPFGLRSAGRGGGGMGGLMVAGAVVAMADKDKGVQQPAQQQQQVVYQQQPVQYVQQQPPPQQHMMHAQPQVGVPVVQTGVPV